MAILDPIKTFFQYQYALWVAVALGVILLVVTTARLGWLMALLHSSWFWGFLVLLLAAGLFAAWRWGVPWLQGWRFAHKQDPAYIIGGQKSPEEIREKFLKALQELTQLPQLRTKEDPLYALPWYLLIGEPGSGKTAAVKGSGLFSPLLTPLADEGQPTQNFNWWDSTDAIVLDTAGRYASPADVARDRAEWFWLLRLLRIHRGQCPINGLVITVPAEKLALQSSEEQLRADATKLRQRIEEAIRELGVDFPVYVLVSKCDQLEGFSEFFSLLPERVCSEVIGYVDDPPVQLQDGDQAQRGTAALNRVSVGLQAIYDRLHLFRLSLLESKAPEVVRQEIFCFPEEFKALCHPLSVFLETLFNVHPHYHTPLLRGIFFTSARQQGVPFASLRRQIHFVEEPPPQQERSTHFFLHDVFSSMLPRDYALTHVTVHGQRRRWFKRSLSVAVSVGLGVFLVVTLLRGFLTDRGLVTAVDLASCPETVQRAGPTPRVNEIENCQRTIQALALQNRQRSRWSTLLFRRSLRLEAELRQRYVRNFKTTVQTPFNALLDRALQGNADPLPVILFLARRIQLSQRCVSSFGCPEPLSDDLQPDYAALLNLQSGSRVSPQEIVHLRDTSTAYILWQRTPPEELQQDLAEDQRRLQRWLSTRQFQPDQLLTWVNRRSPPVTYDTYWELPAPITSVAAPQIEAACTRKVWERDLAPLLQQLQEAVPDAAQKLLTFRQQYLANCFTQWQQFLIGFSQGAERWRSPERRRQLALRLLTERSPYQRVIEETIANLTPWLPAEGETSVVLVWTVSLRSYLKSDQRQVYQDALRKIADQLGDTLSPEGCFKLAQAVFAEGQPKADSANPLLRAWWLATQASQAAGTAQKPNEDLLMPLLQEPVRYVWRTILATAGQHLQKNWMEMVSTQLAGLPPAERVLSLYGPGGKVESFPLGFYNCSRARGRSNRSLPGGARLSPCKCG